MSLTFEQEKNGPLSFLDAEVSQLLGIFVTTIYTHFFYNGIQNWYDTRSSLPMF